MSPTLISIIIAAFNAEKYVGDCLRAIQAQTHSAWEVWICDDNSTDNTLKIIRDFADKDARIHVLHNESNIFSGATRNRCLEQCRGEYVAIQDADDVCSPQRLEILLKNILERQVDFVSSGFYLFDDGGIYRTNIPKCNIPVKKDFLFGIPFCHAATMFNRRSLMRVNGYRVSRETRRGQDFDLFMRLYAAGFRGININNVLYGYRVDRNTISRRKFKYRLDECVIRYKGFKALGLMPRGYIYMLKPIAAHILQIINKNRRA